MEIDIKAFSQLQKLESVSHLDNNIILHILACFENGNKKKISVKKHKHNNIITNSNHNASNKSTKIIVKDNIDNKIKLILNKLSQNNIHNITIEFIKNIKINTQDEFNSFIKIIYLKILAEINFVKVYLEFIKNIICIYTKSFNYSYKYFYDLIENKFMHDYFNISNTIYNDMPEDFKVNNLKLIRYMTNSNFYNMSILNIIDSLILEQTSCLVDIYYWFKDTTISKQNALLIINILSIHLNIDIRDKILLQNLISEYNEPVKNKLVFIKKNNI